MQASKSPHFVTVLQLCGFFKLYCKPSEQDLPESIRLMTLDQLYLNIIHTESESALIKDLLVYVLRKVRNPGWDRNGIGGAVHYLVGGLQDMAGWLLDHYYLQMAVQEYVLLCEQDKEEKEVKGLQKVKQFCELNLETKFDLLRVLTRNALKNLMKPKSKAKEAEEPEEDENKPTSDQTKKKNTQIGQVLLLGEDGKFLYCFAPFMPEYVIAFEGEQWHLMDKTTVGKVIRRVVEMPRSPTNLSLAQNMTTVMKKYMQEVPEVVPIIRIPKLRESYKEKQRARVKDLKDRLMQINDRYSTYLDNFNNKRWGFLHHRIAYTKALDKASTVQQLISAFRIFYEASSKYLFTCLCSDEEAVPEDRASQFYTPEQRQYCNIHTVSNKYAKDRILPASYVSEVMLDAKTINSQALLEINVAVLEMAVKALEIKARKYQKKVEAAQKMKQTKSLEQSESYQLVVQPEVPADRAPKKLGIKLRERRVSKQLSQSISRNNTKQEKLGPRIQKAGKKKYGVCTLDSDSSSSEVSEQQSASNNNKNSNQDESLQKYEYRATRSRTPTNQGNR